MRGAHLAAVQKNGLTMRAGGDELKAAVKASDNPADLGPQEMVISTLKADVPQSHSAQDKTCFLGIFTVGTSRIVIPSG